MASLIYNGALENESKGMIDFDTDTFKAMLVTSTYTPDMDLHNFRSDVTNEVVGAGYSLGGNTVTVTVTRDDVKVLRRDRNPAFAVWRKPNKSVNGPR